MRILSILTLVLVTLIIVACKKDESANPFENATILDCNNLKVTGVEMSETNGVKMFRLTMRNTCNACDRSSTPVYDDIYMISKTTNDTIGFTNCACIAAPENKSSQTFELRRNTDQMPNLSEIKFSMKSTCTDVLYQP